MKVFESNKIKNVAVVAHGGAGKTSFIESLLFNNSLVNRLGKVDDGTSNMDYLPEEIKRKMTISMALAPLVKDDIKINFLDTPGYADFIGDVKSALRVVESLLFTICGVSGVEVQTELIWDYADEVKKPRLVYINKMDRENANFFSAIKQMRELFSEKLIIPVQIPIGSAETFIGVVDLLSMEAYEYKDGKSMKASIPPNLLAEAEALRSDLIEAAAEGDDEIMNKYLEGEDLTNDEIAKGLKLAILSGRVVPVLCGSALKNIATDLVLDFVSMYMPTALETGNVDENGAFSAFVFKTISDNFVGKISMMKIFSGKIKPDTILYNSSKEQEEKITNILVPTGKTQESIIQAFAGDIIAVTKLQYTQTGDTLCTKAKPVILPGIDFPIPTLSMAISPKSKNDEDKLGVALSKIIEEDPTIAVKKDATTGETTLRGLGELHIDCVVERMQRKFGVDIVLSEQSVPYKETVTNLVEKIEGKHKKQSGGHGQYGHVFISMEPNPTSEFEFVETVFGGSVPRNYIPAVEKGLREAMAEGVLAGYPVTNIKVNLTDGSYHPVDSSEMAFKIAAALAFRTAMEKAKPILIEPIMKVIITVPKNFTGDIMGDMNSKRGRILGMDEAGKNQVIIALAPLSEMARYSIELKSMTQGRGSFAMEFEKYDEVPSHIASKVIEKKKHLSK